MQLFLYEWVTGGGLVNHHGPLPESLLKQGKAMIEALAADAAKLSGVETVLFRDLRVHALVAERASVQEIDSRSSHDQLFDQMASESDAVLLLAPETDGILEELVRRSEDLGANLISPCSDFVKIAADKEATAERLIQSGVKTPRAVRIEPEDSLPKEHPYPSVIKPILGAGSEDTYVVSSSSDSPPAHAWPRRLEVFIPGIPASVALLAEVQKAPLTLPPTRQRLTEDGRLEYLGGELPLPSGLANRAKHLARKALSALPSTTGYVGIDLILGSDPDGEEDYVIEINPRLTTSYIGLRHSVEINLVEAMLKRTKINQSIASETIACDPDSANIVKQDLKPMRFDADGAVYFISSHDNSGTL